MGRPSKFDSAFKAKVALEALQEKETLLSLSKKYGVARGSERHQQMEGGTAKNHRDRTNDTLNQTKYPRP